MGDTDAEGLSKFIYKGAYNTVKKATAIITARGGSKGVPRKNLRQVAGVPLIAYTIKAAMECRYIDECYVTTDDREIKDVSISYGAKVIDRPKELAEDNSLSRDAVLHALRCLAEKRSLPEYFTLLQPTSPLRNATHLTTCLSEFFNSTCNCAVAVTEAEHHPWKMLLQENGVLEPVKSSEMLESPRQALPVAYRINGSMYVMATALFMQNPCFFVEPAMPFIMSRAESLDIDTEADLYLLERLLAERK
jgi:CMP-N-acetylneuraminic acid synthetase